MKSVDTYITKHEKWIAPLELLRTCCLKAGFEETVKWGAPTYTIKNKNVIGLVAFKNHIALWFHQGVFLADTHKVLLNANANGKTRGLLQWRFTSLEEVPVELLLNYLEEAKQNELAGKRIIPQKSKKLILPAILKEALTENTGLKGKFEQFAFSKQKEFVNYIEEAKRITTQEKRLEKVKQLIHENIGLNDKYRK